MLELSVMVRVAVRVPMSVGLKETVTVQLPLAARLAPQLLVWLKSPEFVPLNAMLEILRVEFPVLLRMTGWD